METKKVTAPALRGDAQFRAESFDEASNTIDIIFTTGAKVRRYSWSEGAYDEELVVTPGSVRLDRLNAGAPFLDTHSSWELRDVIGSVVPGSAKIENGRGVCKVLLSRAPGDLDTVTKIRDGVIRNISVGYRYHRVEKTDGQDGDPALWRVTDWEPLEVSAVPIPADPGSQIRSAPDARAEQFDFVVETRDEAPASTANPNGEDAMSVKNPAADEERGHEQTIQNPAPVTVDPEAARRAADEAVRAERVRVADINKAVGPFASQRGLADEHIAKGSTVDQFRAALVDALSSETEQTRVNNTAPNRIEVTATQEAARAEGIENALMHRADPMANPLNDKGREYRGMTLLEIARDCLEQRGVKTRGMSKMELATEALAQRSGGMHTTSDFPNLLANVANKTLRAGYEAAPQTFRPLVNVVTVPDFKAVSRLQLGEAPQLTKVNEHGEFQRGSIGEGKESYAIGTFGKIIAITRQVLINDDLAAFTRIPRAFGQQAAQLESDLVWAQILANPTMGDSVALFHANHGNLGTAATISSINGVSEGRKMIGLQTGLDGKTLLNLTPNYIIVPAALQTAAEQFVGQIYAAKNSDVVPDSLKRLQVIAEGRLDLGISRPDLGISISGSSSNWYMAASVAQIDIVELAYLEGAQGLYTETRMGFEVDGVEIKVREDVGAKVIDHRGLYKNPN